MIDRYFIGNSAEKLTLVFIAGFVAILIGVLLINWPTKIVVEQY